MSVELIEGDCRNVLAGLPDSSVHCVVTSPPYFGLRDYGVVGQIGLEPTMAEYVATMTSVFREVRRVLRDDGVLWLNLGDTYATSGGHADSTCTSRRAAYRIGNRPEHAMHHFRARADGASVKVKDMCGIPWRVAFALQEDGWFLRSDCVWHKPNPLPQSVTDRPTTAHEYVFLLSKRGRYFYDRHAVVEPATSGARGSRFDAGKTDREGHSHKEREDAPTRNLRSVWSITVPRFKESHFATFPLELAARCIRSGTSDRGACPECGMPWRRILQEREERGDWHVGDRDSDLTEGAGANTLGGQEEWDAYVPQRTIGWERGCAHGHAAAVPCTVLDPFAGAGTVGVVAQELQRNATLIELSPDYCELIRRRLLVPGGVLRPEHVDPAQPKLPGL